MSRRLKTLVSLIVDQTDQGDLPYIALEHLAGGTGSLEPNVELPRHFGAVTGVSVVQPGDVLFGKLRPYLAKTLLIREPAYASTELLALRAGPELEARYLAYLIGSRPIIEWATATSDGTKMPRTSWEKIGEFRINNLPTLTEQCAVADYLDAKTALIDSLITKKREMIGLLRERFSSEIENALNNGRFRKSRLRWCSIRIADGTHGTYQRQARGYPLLSAKNLRNGCVNTSEDESFVSESDYREISKTCGFRPGDVLYGVIGGSIGNVARFQDGDPTAFQRSVAAVSPSELLLADFLYLVSLGQDFQDQLRLASNSSAQAGVYLGALGDIAIPLPSKPEQEQIVYFLMNLLRLQKSMENAMIRQIDLFQKQRQALVIAATTGEIEVPGEAA